MFAKLQFLRNSGGGLVRPLATFARSYDTEAGRQALRNFLGLGILLGLSLACQMVNTVVLVHSLAQREYGAYLFCLSFLPYLYSVGSLAAGAISVREIRRDPERLSEIASSSLLTSLALSVLMSLGMVVAVVLVPMDAGVGVLVLALAVSSIFMQTSAGYLFDAAHRQPLGAAATAIADWTATIVLAALAWSGNLTLIAVAAVIPCRAFLAMGMQWLFYLLWVHRIEFGPRGATAREVLVASLPLMANGCLHAAHGNLSLVLVLLRFGQEQTALYGVAVLIAASVFALMEIALRVTVPHVYGPHGLERSFVAKLAAFLGAYVVAVSLGVGGVMTLFVVWFLPPAYGPLVAPSCWLIAAAGVRIAWEIAGTYLARRGRQVLSSCSMIAIIGAANGLGWLLSSPWGLAGFAIGTFATYLVAALLHFRLAIWVNRSSDGPRES